MAFPNAGAAATGPEDERGRPPARWLERAIQSIGPAGRWSGSRAREVPDPIIAHPAAASLAWTAIWGLVVWVVLFWKLGFPSFWDPDEATYALASREMLRTGNWLVPTIGGVPFFDKPPLFYALQGAAFSAFGVSEWSARLVPALATIPVLLFTAWAGRSLFSKDVGRLAPLMLAVLPATFALSGYAILDMLFTASLFGAVALMVVSIAEDRPRLQWAAFVLLVPAVLTKGPLAIVLTGLAYLLAFVRPSLRRRLWSRHWIAGPLLTAGLSLPWFVAMWMRYGDRFIDGYLLRENILLYARPLYGERAASLNYLSVLSVGLLPWTPVVVGRLFDGVRGRKFSDGEFLLGAWIVALLAFFSLSRFKLDHYVYPAAPAVCLLVAAAWCRAQEAARGDVGTRAGVALVGAAQFLGGSYVLFVVIPDLSVDVSRWIYLMPGALILAGAVSLVDQWRRGWAPRRLPLVQVAALLVVFSVVLTAGMSALERAKPVKDLALTVRHLAHDQAAIGGYRLNRWSPSWRFYLDRPSDILETPADLVRFFRKPGRHFCLMFGHEWVAAQSLGLKARVLFERRGLLMTTGRGLRGGIGSQASFVVITDLPAGS